MNNRNLFPNNELRQVPPPGKTVRTNRPGYRTFPGFRRTQIPLYTVFPMRQDCIFPVAYVEICKSDDDSELTETQTMAILQNLFVSGNLGSMT